MNAKSIPHLIMCLVYFLQRGSHVVKLFCVDAAFQRDIESELVVLSAMNG